MGIRVPEHAVAQALLETLGEPLISCTLQFPDADGPVSDPQEVRQRLSREVDLVLDAGNCGLDPTTVLDLTPMGAGDEPAVLRQGAGLLDRIGL